jgi:hypothetical protein
MSTLVLVLVTTMAVPGSGPEMVSGEMEQGLDLRGKWKGTLHLEPHRVKSVEVWPDGDWSEIHTKDEPGFYRVKTRNEGGGRVSLNFSDEVVFLGIYRQDGDHTIICFRVEGEGRPISFQAGDSQHLLILHRVKPRK